MTPDSLEAKALQLLEALAAPRPASEPDGVMPWQWPLAGDTARAVRMLRAWIGCSRAELARMIGVHPATVAAWERSETVPARPAWEAMARTVPLGTLYRWITGTP